MKLLISASLLLGYLPLAMAQTCNTQSVTDVLDSRYTLNVDSTAYDQQSGLTWMRCTLGQTWDGGTCIGAYQSYTWWDALKTADSTTFAGHGDWRLPNKKELRSLVDYRCYMPAINLTAFPNNPPSVGFWSSSPHAYNSGYAWIVYFGSGYDNYGSNYSYNAVRLVRTGQ